LYLNIQKEDWTPLDCAENRQNEEVIKLLLLKLNGENIDIETAAVAKTPSSSANILANTHAALNSNPIMQNAKAKSVSDMRSKYEHGSNGIANNSNNLNTSCANISTFYNNSAQNSSGNYSHNSNYISGNSSGNNSSGNNSFHDSEDAHNSHPYRVQSAASASTNRYPSPVTSTNTTTNDSFVHLNRSPRIDYPRGSLNSTATANKYQSNSNHHSSKHHYTPTNEYVPHLQPTVVSRSKSAYASSSSNNYSGGKSYSQPINSSPTKSRGNSSYIPSNSAIIITPTTQMSQGKKSVPHSQADLSRKNPKSSKINVETVRTVLLGNSSSDEETEQEKAEKAFSAAAAEMDLSPPMHPYFANNQDPAARKSSKSSSYDGRVEVDEMLSNEGRGDEILLQEQRRLKLSEVMAEKDELNKRGFKKDDIPMEEQRRQKISDSVSKDSQEGTNIADRRIEESQRELARKDLLLQQAVEDAATSKARVDELAEKLQTLMNQLQAANKIDATQQSTDLTSSSSSFVDSSKPISPSANINVESAANLLAEKSHPISSKEVPIRLLILSLKLKENHRPLQKS